MRGNVDSDRRGFLVLAGAAVAAGPALAGTGTATRDGGYHEAMQDAGGAFRDFRNAARDLQSESGRASAAEAAQKLAVALVTAIGYAEEVEIAPQSADTYGDDTAAYAKDMKLQLIESAKATLDMQAALLEGDVDAAREHFRAVQNAQRSGHRTFKE